MKLSTLTLACSALLATVFSSNALAARDCQPIRRVPVTIHNSGKYCLAGDLSTSISGTNDAAIRIEADDVVLDLRGHVLDGSLADVTTTRAQGILAGADITSPCATARYAGSRPRYACRIPPHLATTRAATS